MKLRAALLLLAPILWSTGPLHHRHESVMPNCAAQVIATAGENVKTAKVEVAHIGRKVNICDASDTSYPFSFVPTGRILQSLFQEAASAGRIQRMTYG